MICDCPITTQCNVTLLLYTKFHFPLHCFCAIWHPYRLSPCNTSLFLFSQALLCWGSELVRTAIGRWKSLSCIWQYCQLSQTEDLSRWQMPKLGGEKKKRKRMHFTTLIWSVIMHEVSTHKRVHVTENPNFTLKCPRSLTGMCAEFDWEANGELKKGQLVELSAYKIVRQRRVDCDEELAVIDYSSWLLGLLTLLTLLEISNRRSPLRKQKQ